jgi:type I restriction enzyme S subunit
LPEQIQQIASKLPTIVSSQPMIEWVDSEWLNHRLDVRFYEPRFWENLAELSTLQMEQTSLKHLAKLNGGGAFPAAEFSDGGPIPTAKIGDITHQRCPNEWVRLTYQAFEKFGRAETRYPDVLVTMTGDPPDVGKCMMVPQWDTLIAYNQRVARARFDGSSANSFYVCAFMSTERARLQLEKVCTGIRQRHVTLDDIREMIVPLPPRPVQEYVGAKVRLAERCRTRARELWEASEQLLSEALGMSLEAKHFEQVHQAELQSNSYQLVSVSPVANWVQPDIVERELGSHYYHPRRANVILKLRSSGVELERLANLTERRSGRVRADKVSQVPYYVGLADIDGATGYFEPVPTQEAGISGASALFESGDILFSKLRPYLNKVSICPAYVTRACGSTELLIYRVHKSVFSYFVFFAIKSNLGLYQILDVTAGSTLPRVDPEIVDDILVPIIPTEQQQTIDTSIRQVFALRNRATQLVREAKADVEALIEGRLDVEGIVAGQVQPPTWEDVEA